MGGMDWLRWHHGSVTDPKFQLVAKKSGASVAEVVALWAFALEEASLADDRGSIAGLDVESVECLLGIEDGKGTLILDAMEVRGLTSNGRIASWDKRQPAREREDNTAAERKRRQRERDALPNKESPENGNVTPSHTESHQETPRVEKSREEKSKPISVVEHVGGESSESHSAANSTRKGQVCGMLRKAGMADAAPHYLTEETWCAILAKRTDEEIVSVAIAKMAARPGKRTGLKYIAPILLQDPEPISANARASPYRQTGRQSRVDNYAADAAAARGEHENEYGTGRTERDITSESHVVA